MVHDVIILVAIKLFFLSEGMKRVGEHNSRVKLIKCGKNGEKRGSS